MSIFIPTTGCSYLLHLRVIRVAVDSYGGDLHLTETLDLD
jgi:hypothetical protein